MLETLNLYINLLISLSLCNLLIPIAIAMQSFLSSQSRTRRTPSTRAGPSSQTLRTHFASSRRLEKARALSPSPSSASSQLSTPSREALLDESSKAFPCDRRQNLGIDFQINWGNIHLRER